MLPRKWDPCYMLPEDYKEAPEQLEVGFEFDRCVTTHGPVTNAFRIFTEGRVSNVLPDLRIAAPTTIVKVATSGAYQEITSTNESRAGAGIFTAGENGLERALKVPQSLHQSDQAGGVLAAKILADSVNPRYTLHNDTNSKHLLRHLILSRESMEDSGYIGIPDKDILQSMIASYRRRKQISTVNWVKKHCDHQGISRADSLAEEGTRAEEVDLINLEIPLALRLSGAKLAKMSQNHAYRVLREHKNNGIPHRKSMADNVKRAQLGACSAFGINPNKAALWKSLKHRDIDRNTAYLLWMTMHDAYWIGSKWLNFGPQYHEHGYCKHCNDNLEDMDHIMMLCKTPGQKEVWDLTRKILEKRGIQWQPPSMGNILSCSVPVFKSRNGIRDGGKERFYQMIMSMSIQIIWNFRKKALQKDLVLETWSGVIKDEHRLPRDWTETDGVLVGME
ncbi:hypothetical protein F5146DRAFT_1010429 [Armillaria mellea]|nr:hypothetical protein F5146DRAFT_1010429 [Armillaria mellea]